MHFLGGSGIRVQAVGGFGGFRGFRPDQGALFTKQKPTQGQEGLHMGPRSLQTEKEIFGDEWRGREGRREGRLGRLVALGVLRDVPRG